jgi:hypothetical protein
MSKEARTRSLKLNLVEDRDSVSLPFAEDLKIPPLESLRTNHPTRVASFFGAICR